MSLREFPGLVQGSQEWLACRRGVVTASVVGQLITPSTRKLAGNDRSRGITARLVAERITGQVEPVPVSEDMWRGVIEEPRARARYAGRYHLPVTETGFLLREEPTWRLGYSPDGLAGADGLIEIKCPRAKGHLATILTGEVPAQYVAQCQAGLLVSGRAWLDYISYCGGMPLWHTRVYPDPAWQAAIIAACERFETTAVEMTAAYTAKTAGLPDTERIATDLEVRI